MALMEAEDEVRTAFETGGMDLRRCNRFLRLFREMDKVMESWNRAARAEKKGRQR
jgi:hypothetical protein